MNWCESRAHFNMGGQKKANVMSNKLCKVPSMLLWSHYTQHFIPVVQFFGEKITGHNAKTSYYYCF